MADAKAIVEKLYQAFNDPGFLGMGGTDEESALEALRMARDQGLMKEVDALYAKTYPGEPNLKEEIDDELGGDDFDAAMKLYDEGMKAAPKASPAAPGGGSLPGAAGGGGTGMTPEPRLRVSGTLAPKGGNWPAAVLATLTELQGKMERGYAPIFGFPGEKTSHFDRDNWIQNLSDTTGGHTVAYSPLKRPYEAVGALFAKLEKWELDCATFAEVALLLIWRRFLGSEAKFDKRFSGLILRNQHSAGLPIQTAVVQPDEPSQLPGFNAAWDAAPVGTKISWKNLSQRAAGTPWEHEFGIKRRKDGSANGTTYDAFPLGWDLTEDAIRRSLAEQALDFPMRFTLTREAMERIEAEEWRLRPLHLAMAQSIGVPYHDRLAPEVIRNLKSDVVGNPYDNAGKFRHALVKAGVPDVAHGFLEVFKDQADREADPAPADAYVRKNIIRYDFSRPILP